MKGKRIIFVLLFAMVIAIGWLVTVKAVTGNEVMKKQDGLVEEADRFMQKKLYIRAIPLYVEALTLSTEQNPSIQKKLLAAYADYGDLDSYVRLVEKRISEGNAVEEEYIRAADYYLTIAKLEDAMLLIQRGIESLQSDRLEEYYEEHRYVYQLSGGRYADILPAGENTLMPACDGDHWGYIDLNGREALDFIYDSATAFNTDGYAAVLLDGNYYTILINGDRYGVDDGTEYARMTNLTAVSGTHILGERDGAYSYFNYDFEPVASGHQYQEITANACGVAAVRKGNRWGIITDSGAVVVDFIYEDVAVNSLGGAFAGNRAMVKENGQWYLIDTEGNRIGTEGYAAAKAPESEGYIAVADNSGRWGYIDREGKKVIEFQYRDAYSFSDGVGAVQSVNVWSYISEKNVMVIDLPMTSALPFHGGVAVAEFSDGKCLITLKYYEKE